MDRIKNGLRRISIPAAFVICGIGCLLTALALTKVTVSVAKRNMTAIVRKYGESPADAFVADHFVIFSTSDANQPEEKMGMVVLDGGEAEVQIGKIVPLDNPDRERFDFYAHMGEIAAVLWYTVCLAVFALIFYRWKIRRPYRALMEAVFNISDSNLDFQMGFEGQDELGRLCRAFEFMRRELVRNNQKMWDAVEERKRLNAAFAHDLRTPLTVMRGHAEIIESQLDEREDTDGIRASVREIAGQIDRLSSFAHTMGRIQRLEDFEPRAKTISVSELSSTLTETARLLYPAATVETPPELAGLTLFTDKEALMQIVENVISNAARHAREKIAVSFGTFGELAVIAVQDDGAGFSQGDLSMSRTYRDIIWQIMSRCCGTGRSFSSSGTKGSARTASALTRRTM